jgi:hypothetical protein
MTFRSRKFLDVLRKIECQAPDCGADDGTIVGCHVNHWLKGMGHKPSDAAAFAGCYRCHCRYDQGKDMSKDERRMFATEALARSYVTLLERGFLVVK